MTLKAMIVDDEPFVRKDLRHMLRVYDELEVICEAGTISEAKRELEKNTPDVVFLDIQLRGGTGFDLVPFIDSSAKIIFITAHDEFAIRAFEVNALDYIRKPVSRDRLAESISRLKPDKKKQAKKQSAPTTLKPEDQVFIRTDSSQLFISLPEIIAISSLGGNYVKLHLKNGQNHVCRKTFKVWESILPQSVFMRIHRSAIINLKFIEQITSKPDGSGLVKLSQQELSFPVNRRMVKKLKALVKDYLI